MLRVEANYASGVPQTIVSGFAPRGLAMHWTAGGTGRAGALGTLKYLIDSRYVTNASYHILVWPDYTAQATYAMWIVPPGRASHSMNPGNAYVYSSTKDRATQDRWFAEVRRILGIKATDPNAGCIAISFCGMPTDLEEAMGHDWFVADMRQLVAEVSEIPSITDRPLFNHGWIQPSTRYDAGEALIPALYGEDMAVFTRPVREKWKIPSGTEFYTGGPAMGEQKWFTAAVELWSNGESTDGLWRRCEYGVEELWLRRKSMTAISGTRNPATGYGEPFLSGYTKEQLDAAKAEGAKVGKADMHAKAIVSAENHLAEVRSLT